MPATAEPTPVLPGLSPICGRPIEARFDAAPMSSDGGLWCCASAKPSVDVCAGWWYLALDFDRGRMALDTAMSGPILAATFRFYRWGRN